MHFDNKNSVHIVGGGLAGCEAAWQLAERNIDVILHEMRPIKNTDAHQTDKLAELVCSNSFRSDDADYNAVGLLHYEMRKLKSLIMHAADKNKIPAGSALAVDREGFSKTVHKSISDHPRIKIITEEIETLKDKKWSKVIISTGPLTSSSLSNSLIEITGEESLAFFDAIAPIVTKESINFNIAWYQSRYDKGDGNDYINCPLNKEEYNYFYNLLIKSEKVNFKEWEKNTPYFEGCLPIEIMAQRGIQTLRYGPLKPVGLTNKHTPDQKPWAVVQLRQDNAAGTLYNLVGFQTKLKYGEQNSLLKSIPGLENSDIVRFGGIHRNTFINSPKLLDERLNLKSMPHIKFAGQITGCEGYVESSAIGLLSGIITASEINGRKFLFPPNTSAIGSLLEHITKNSLPETYQPMNINFGLFPPLNKKEVLNEKNKPLKGRDRKKAFTERAIRDIDDWINLTN